MSASPDVERNVSLDDVQEPTTENKHQAYARSKKDAKEQQGQIFNYYLNDEDRPAAELLTQIVVPIK